MLASLWSKIPAKQGVHAENRREICRTILFQSNPTVHNLWDPCLGKLQQDPLEELNKMHVRAAKIIFKYDWRYLSCEVISSSKWNTLYWNYKYKLATFAHQDIFSEGNTNKLLKQRNSVYLLRGSNKLILPRPCTDILRNSVTYRPSTLWNNLKDCTTTVSDFNSFKKLVKEQLKSLTFLPNCGKNDDFIYF